MKRLLGCFVLVTGLMAMAATPASAGAVIPTIVISDLGTSSADNITFSVTGFSTFSVLGSPLTLVNGAGSRTVDESTTAINFGGTWAATTTTTTTTNTFLFIEGQGSNQVSDILTYTVASTGGTTGISGSFQSDSPSGNGFIRLLGPNEVGIVENGSAGNEAGVTNVVSVLVKSDIDVPEPASLTLLGLGAATMAGYGWRRRRGARQ